jgi:hypothetical protein
MPRRRHQPPVRYAVAEQNGAHQVVDQLHGYTLSAHTTRSAAEAAARELASDPAAAVAAVEAVGAAQSGQRPPSGGSCAGTDTPGACARRRCSL